MTFKKASPLAALAAVSFLLQACVESLPDQGGYAQRPPPPQPPPEAPAYAPEPAAYSPPQPPPQSQSESPLDTLLAPIALYPDPLIALILPASTVPWDVSSAADYLVQYGDMTRVDSQPWDPSVRALAHYPSIVSWMAGNIAWTQALGNAFSSAPSDVMDSVQRLRARAVAAGTLASTPQQRVAYDGDQILILPAQPDRVYVPAYDPNVVYSDERDSGYDGPYLYFGEPYPEGLWLSYSFDWRRHRVWEGDRDGWREHEGWTHSDFRDGRAPAGAHAWQPRPDEDRRRKAPSVPKGSPPPLPHPMRGAPVVPPTQYRRPAVQPNPEARHQGQAPQTYRPAPNQGQAPQATRPAPTQGQAQQPVRPAPQQGQAPQTYRPAPNQGQAPQATRPAATPGQQQPARQSPPLDRPRLGAPPPEGGTGPSTHAAPPRPPETEHRPPEAQPRQAQPHDQLRPGGGGPEPERARPAEHPPASSPSRNEQAPPARGSDRPAPRAPAPAAHSAPAQAPAAAPANGANGANAANGDNKDNKPQR